MNASNMSARHKQAVALRDAAITLLVFRGKRVVDPSGHFNRQWENGNVLLVFKTPYPATVSDTDQIIFLEHKLDRKTVTYGLEAFLTQTDKVYEAEWDSRLVRVSAYCPGRWESEVLLLAENIRAERDALIGGKMGDIQGNARGGRNGRE